MTFLIAVFGFWCVCGLIVLGAAAIIDLADRHTDARIIQRVSDYLVADDPYDEER